MGAFIFVYNIVFQWDYVSSSQCAIVFLYSVYVSEVVLNQCLGRHLIKWKYKLNGVFILFLS